MDTVDTAFGSDRFGLVWGYRFAAGGAAEPVDCEAAAALLASTSPGTRPDEFVWLHFSLSNAAAERWIRQHLTLPEAFHDALQEGVGATRVEQVDDALVAILYDVLFEFRYDASEVSTVVVCVQPHLLVSARLRPLRSLDRLRLAVRSGAGFTSPVELLAVLLLQQAEVMVDIVRQTTRRVDGIEDQLLVQRVSVGRAELSALRRLLVRLQRLLTPEPAALFRLLNRPPAWIRDPDIQTLRQSAEEFATAVADSAALVERIRLLQEELAAVVNEQTNRILFLLTVVTVLALPFNVIAGIFGMNVGGIPFANHRHGFWIVIALVAGTTACAGWWALHRRKSW
jgi:zinc transporter